MNTQMINIYAPGGTRVVFAISLKYNYSLTLCADHHTVTRKQIHSNLDY